MTPEDRNRTSVLSLCDRHRDIEARQDELQNQLGDIESILVKHHRWFELSRVERRTLPAAQIMYDMEDELEHLQSESAKLVINLQSTPAESTHEVIAKLQVVARVILPDDYPDAHELLTGTIARLITLMPSD